MSALSTEFIILFYVFCILRVSVSVTEIIDQLHSPLSSTYRTHKYVDGTVHKIQYALLTFLEFGQVTYRKGKCSRTILIFYNKKSFLGHIVDWSRITGQRTVRNALLVSKDPIIIMSQVHTSFMNHFATFFIILPFIYYHSNENATL